MSSNNFDDQPVQAIDDQVEHEDTSSGEDTPKTKSNTVTNHNAPPPRARFSPGNIVHMPIKEKGVRRKGSFIIHLSRYNKSLGYNEYQLMEPMFERLHDSGAWFRERDLKIDRA